MYFALNNKATHTCSGKLSERPLHSVVARMLAKLSMHLEDLATDNLDTGFLGFLCLQASSEMVPKFEVNTACL
jgi:hypothetical protein